MGAGLLGGMQLGRFEEGTARCTEALRIYRRLGNRRQMAMALRNLGVIAHSHGDNQRARELFDESLEYCRALGDEQGTGLVLVSLGIVLHDQGDLEGATAAFEEAHRREEAANAAPVPGFALTWLAHLALDRERLDEARRRLHEGLNVYGQMGHILVPQLGLSVAGGIAVVEGHNERGARLYGAQYSLMERVLLRWTGSPRCDREGQQLVEQGRHQIGAQAWDRAWAEGQAMTVEQAIAYALEDEADE
jgi:non-specific serine/threonine protein kinase